MDINKHIYIYIHIHTCSKKEVYPWHRILEIGSGNLLRPAVNSSPGGSCAKGCGWRYAKPGTPWPPDTQNQQMTSMWTSINHDEPFGSW